MVDDYTAVAVNKQVRRKAGKGLPHDMRPKFWALGA